MNKVYDELLRCQELVDRHAAREAEEQVKKINQIEKMTHLAYEYFTEEKFQYLITNVQTIHHNHEFIIKEIESFKHKILKTRNIEYEEIEKLLIYDSNVNQRTTSTNENKISSLEKILFWKGGR